ncbi:tripartite tricarboxylate transporter substrate binding protein [Agarilytica rhodophyticola]|uniref:tripartite tricarboxylate transporter substrate binding protein n=1 Tax=Agarilytica rhodophyticola TaxID=1737490 RepID=UPI000B34410D|nr:tripartite tricarboxylate transporter substrate binding protein [Agarilytica rhodophyticola]
MRIKNCILSKALSAKALYILLSVFLLSACKDNNGANNNDWPNRSTNIVVYSSAGGSTDLANRAIAKSMKESLGVDVIASNMPGALGATAINYVWNQRHDGYRMVGISEGVLSHSVLGLHTSTAKDWEYFMIGGTPGIISVSNDSPYKNFEDLYQAIKNNPGQIKIATSVPGCIWNVQWLLAKNIAGFDTRFVPYPGSFPSQTAALSGEVDIVWTGLGEQSEFIKGKKLRALASFSQKDIKFNGETIPSITNFIPDLKTSMPVNQFVGFALPSDTPKNILDTVTESFKVAMQGESVKQFGEAKYSELYGFYGHEAKQIALDQEKVFAWTLWDAGLGKKNPEELGIARP